MNLDDYLIQLDCGNTSAPDKLTLQPGFVKQPFDLYTDAEARGLERGGPLLCDRATRTFAMGEGDRGPEDVDEHPGHQPRGEFRRRARAPIDVDRAPPRLPRTLDGGPDELQQDQG